MLSVVLINRHSIFIIVILLCFFQEQCLSFHQLVQHSTTLYTDNTYHTQNHDHLYSRLNNVGTNSDSNYIPSSLSGLTKNHLINGKSGNYFSKTALYSTTKADSIQNQIVPVKLPIIQIIKGDRLTNEFICGNELSESINNFKNLLKILETDTQNESSPGRV